MSTSEPPVASRPSEERHDFETLIATLSSRLLAASAEDVDSVVLAGLEDVRSFFQADRCVLMTVSADGLVVQACHRSCGHGVEPVSRETDLGQLFPWSRRRLVEEGMPAQIDRLDDLPPQAAVDRAAYAGMSVRSSLAVPMFIGRRVARLIGVQTVNEELAWSAGHVARLRLVGETLVNALERAGTHLARESARRATVAADSATRPALAPPSGQGHGAGWRGTANPQAGRPVRHLIAASGGRGPPVGARRGGTLARSAGGREPLLAAGIGPAVRGQPGGRPECGHSAHTESRGAGGPHQRHGADHGGNRDRQGANRHADSREQPSPRASHGARQLLGDPGDARRVRALRTREGRLHRGPVQAAGALRDGRRLDPVPRRGGRLAGRRPGEVAARAAGTDLRAPGEPPPGEGERADHRGHESGARRGRTRRPVPQRPLLSPQRLPDRGAAAARASRGPPVAGRDPRSRDLRGDGEEVRRGGQAQPRRAAATLLARQRARTAQRARAGDDPVAGTNALGRPPVDDRRVGHGQRGRERCGHARRHRAPAHPQGADRHRLAQGPDSASVRLGLKPSTLYSRIKKLGIVLVPHRR